jgi:hypothetical protein
MTLFGQLIVAALGVRAGYLSGTYWASGAGTPRFYVESAWFAFLLVGSTFRFLHTSGVEFQQVATNNRRPVALVASCTIALALYWPALSIGFLSDDFVLVERASRWNLQAFNEGAFRPIPLFIWAMLTKLNRPVMLHLFNILLHGVNAYLAGQVVKGWVPRPYSALLAACVYVASSAAVEAVAWCFGVFDVLATALVLSCVLAGRRYPTGGSGLLRIAFFGLGLAALATKETAAVAGVLVFVDAYLCKVRSRLLALDAAVLTAISVVYGLFRMATIPHVTTAAMNLKFIFQRTLFGGLEALAAPWHFGIARNAAWIPQVGTIGVVALSLAFLIRPSTKSRSIAAFGALLWIVLPLLPVLPFFVVGPDLQGSRFVYLSAVGWVGLVVVMSEAEHGVNRSALTAFGALAAVVVWVALTATAARLHLASWTEAANTRDAVQTAARRDLQAPDVTPFSSWTCLITSTEPMYSGTERSKPWLLSVLTL